MEAVDEMDEELDLQDAELHERLTDERIEEMLAAFRAGDVDRLQALGAETWGPLARKPEPVSGQGQDPHARPAASPVRAPAKKASQRDEEADEGRDITEVVAEARTREELVRAALIEAFPGAAADERLLHELVAAESGLLSLLQRTEIGLGVWLNEALTDPKASLTLIRLLRDVIDTSTMVRRRLEGALGVAANLRAQRHVIAPQARGRAHGV